MTTPYTPPTDRMLELQALQLTVDILRKDGITNPGDVRKIHNGVLRLLSARKRSPQDIARHGVLEKLEAANGD